MGYKNWLGNKIRNHFNQFVVEPRDGDRAVVRPLVIRRDDNDVSEENDSESGTDQGLSNKTWPTPHLRESLIGSLNI